MKYLILFLMTISAHASETWFCTEGSSYRTEHTVYACGIGHSEDEQLAREKAFDAAVREFQRIESGRAYTIKPLRTSCSNGTCHRMIAFELGEVTMQAMVFASNRQMPTGKIYVGMKKKDMLHVMGKPRVASSALGYTDYVYDGNRCNSLICTVIVKGGQVVEIDNVSEQFVEEL